MDVPLHHAAAEPARRLRAGLPAAGRRTARDHPARSTVAGPYGFESGEDGWTAGSTNQVFSLWRRLAPGNGSTFGFAVTPYNGDGLGSVTTTLTSPKIDQSGGWTYVEFAARYDTEPTFDYVFVDWSCDGGAWNTATSVWDPATGGWSDSFQMHGAEPELPALRHGEGRLPGAGRAALRAVPARRRLATSARPATPAPRWTTSSSKH